MSPELSTYCRRIYVEQIRVISISVLSPSWLDCMQILICSFFQKQNHAGKTNLFSFFTCKHATGIDGLWFMIVTHRLMWFNTKTFAHLMTLDAIKTGVEQSSQLSVLRNEILRNETSRCHLTLVFLWKVRKT